MFVRLMEDGELDMLPHHLLEENVQKALPSYYGFKALNSLKGEKDYLALSAQNILEQEPKLYNDNFKSVYTVRLF